MTNRNSNKKIDRLELFIKERYVIMHNLLSLDLEFYDTKGNLLKGFRESDLEVDIYRNGNLGGFKDMLKSLLGSQFVKKYNPFEKYIKGLAPYDPTKEPDYISQLSSYIETTDDDWFRTQFKKMMVRTTACALRGISENRQCFTFIGKQRDGKTYFLRYLCPPALKEYFTENMDFNSKDGDLALSTNYFVLLDDFTSNSIQNLKKIKQMFTAEATKIRASYDRKSIRRERYASFFATTNDKQFLYDTTGNTRWLVFDIKSINHDDGGMNGYQSVNIDDVYRQAYFLSQNGFDFQLTSSEVRKSEENNRAYMVADPYIDKIRESIFKPTQDEINEFWLYKDDPDHEYHKKLGNVRALTATQITELLGLRVGVVRVIGKKLSDMGFLNKSIRIKGRNDGSPAYFWLVITEKSKNEVSS